MDPEVDVAVAGGGPAGCATALALRAQGRRVLVMERMSYSGFRAGETLPPRIQEPLVALGVWDRFLADGHVETSGIQAAWDDHRPHENAFVFDPFGRGWHVERARFDAMLATAARDAGALVWTDTRCVSWNRAPAGWVVRAQTSGGPRRIPARFIVDATGRASTIGRRLGAVRRIYDRLVGSVMQFEAASEGDRPHQTFVEAAEDGWWYAADVPGGRVVVAWMTDADLVEPRSTERPAEFEMRLRASTLIGPLVEGLSARSVPRTFVADSSCLEPAAGDGWIAVGDACMAFDPLSSQGIHMALTSAILAARALDEEIAGNAGRLRAYALGAAGAFARYLDAKAMYYRRQSRWPDSTFWRRRRAAPSLQPFSLPAGR